MRETRILWRGWHRVVDGDKRALEMFPFVYGHADGEESSFSFGW